MCPMQSPPLGRVLRSPEPWNFPSLYSPVVPLEQKGNGCVFSTLCSPVCIPTLQATLRGDLQHCILQLSAMDASARTTMKGAAKCDKHCELQNSANQ